MKEMVGLFFLGITVSLSVLCALVLNKRRQELKLKQDYESALKRESDLLVVNREQSQFAVLASHDLKEPVRTVSSCLQLLVRQSEKALDSESLEYLHFAVKACERMTGLIDSLWNYSQLDRSQINLETVNLNEILEVTQANLEAVISQSRAEIHSSNLPTVVADPVQVIQVFQHLIDNAIKFRSDGRPKVEVSATRCGESWKISISDGGIGVPPEFAERVFKPLQRLHGRDEYAGAGIGLAICKKIVEKHGGQIWVDSNEGKRGSAFCFTLPAIRS